MDVAKGRGRGSGSTSGAGEGAVAMARWLMPSEGGDEDGAATELVAVEVSVSEEDVSDVVAGMC